LGPVAIVPLRASNSELGLSGGTVGAAVERCVPIRQSLAARLRPEEICKVLEGIVQLRNPALFSFVSDLDRYRQKVVARHGFPGRARGGSWRLGS
jgi:hypothetical protein